MWISRPSPGATYQAKTLPQSIDRHRSAVWARSVLPQPPNPTHVTRREKAAIPNQTTAPAPLVCTRGSAQPRRQDARRGRPFRNNASSGVRQQLNTERKSGGERSQKWSIPPAPPAVNSASAAARAVPRRDLRPFCVQP